MSPLTTTLAAAAAALMLAACGATPTEDESVSSPSNGGAAGTCLEGTPDCVDADLSGDPADDPILDDSFDHEVALDNARSLLGEPEQEVLDLWADTRLGRRGDEHFAVTDDYVIGRMTLATEDVDGEFRVVEVTVELPDGPMTVTG